MSAFRSFFYALLKWPIKLLVRSNIICDKSSKNEQSLYCDDAKQQPMFYVVRHQSASDLLTLQQACKKQNLPDPLDKIIINGEQFDRTLCLAKPSSILSWHKRSKTHAVSQGLDVLVKHQQDKNLDAQLIPVNMTWGRTPTKEKNNADAGTLLADQESPNFLRKFFIVLFLGRRSLVRFSQPVSFRYMADNHGVNEKTAHKLLRVARFHFYRQTVSVTGRRLMHRQQMFTALLANPAIKRVIEDEASSKNISLDKAKKKALGLMDEIAGDYRDSMIRVSERVLGWLWKRLYRDIKVHNSDTLRQLAQDGHEIIYVPCHRSHMDYLLLTYIIYHQGLVTPRIAAGINLNFWPAGPIFRKSGAFFIRRSFGGNRLYSTIFREYLGLLFERGYSVKYYAEGGRSRTGKILPPKTGMFAMTIQSMLRGINRPLSIVPVYLGYDHVMEVATYHKELSGGKKKKESILGVIKAIRSLRNYGNGYVNFGEPININHFLNEHVPDWKQAIDPIDPQKPSWLTPTVNVLANQVMAGVNKNAAISGVALVALILLASEHRALTKTELITQLDFFLTMQRQAPYSTLLTIPELTGASMLAEVISLNKVTIERDEHGEIISLPSKSALEMSYYRNNILHTYVLPSLVCSMLTRFTKISEQALINNVKTLMALMQKDLFLWQQVDDISEQIKQVLAFLLNANIVKHTKADFWSLSDDVNTKNKIRLMSLVIDETLQRFAILTSLVKTKAPLTRSELEKAAVIIAKRLSVINHINSPEFTDKKAQTTLINAMKDVGFIENDKQGKLIKSESFNELFSLVNSLVNVEVLQSINLQ
ncbi:MAG: glycerol-3-phosphate 1-O-acyltransferase PlsB [Alteromonadaceae bacterium]|nr:glycerol-3-phosphate 1-O-acyltransferase PlsB [Alteromonadaceae bacterium]